MHDEDSATLWFGVTRDSAGRARFEDHGRYAALMANSPSGWGVSSVKHPQLVSFIGVTNAGKSTIIKMLIDSGRLRDPTTAKSQYPSPVVGSMTNDKLPTSGDVHLYADPLTSAAMRPILFADCEGLEGGEGEPYGAQSRKRAHPGSNKLRKSQPQTWKGRPRDIVWADTDMRRKREYSVTQLYPRLLYTFSDVIAFVLRNAKTFQSSVLIKLLDWGEASLEKSLNQATLPHAVIVLNASDVGIDQSEWDPRVATERLLEMVKSACDRVGGVPEILNLMNIWRQRGVEIRKVEDLISKYYSSFTVVRIPDKGRYTLMNEQVVKLRQVIDGDCRESFEAKHKARMLCNSDDLNVYLQAAFDHFTTNLDVPFNFIDVSLRYNPLPENFGDHIVRLAKAIKELYAMSYAMSGQWIFDRLGSMGPPKISSPNTEIIWSAPSQNFAVHQKRDTQNEKGVTSLDVVLDMHRKRMGSFYQSMGGAVQYISHATCLCCLKEVPEHALPCGHVLCARCIRAYGRRHPDNSITINFCPLHSLDHFRQPWRIRWKPEHAGVRVLCLDGGGIRSIVELQVLQLIEDALGGSLPIQAFFDLIIGTSTGGVVALAVGVKQWPISRCINAFAKICDQGFVERPFAGVPVLEQMSSLTHGSKYKTRPWQRVLENSLGTEALFGGERKANPKFAIKVGVTATSGTAKDALLISNYSRPRSSAHSGSYTLVRCESPDQEFRISEAAAATSAAPGYFKAFYHRSTQKHYLDGAVHNNNPVHVADKEWKLLWPDIADSQPDLLLSIGTAIDAGSMAQDLDLRETTIDGSASCPVAPTTQDLNLEPGSNSRLKAWAQSGKHQVLRNFNTSAKGFDSIVDAQLSWRKFKQNARRSDWPGTKPERYIRFNPDLGCEPPPLDAKRDFDKLGRDVNAELHSCSYRRDAQSVAFQLIASTFYFSRLRLQLVEGTNTHRCKGMICCRFENDSQHLQELGRFLQNQLEFEPEFLFREERRDEDVLTVPLTPQLILGMINHKAFEVEVPEFYIHDPTAATNIVVNLVDRRHRDLGMQWYSLSGFPRCIATEDSRRLSMQAGPEPFKAGTKSVRMPLRHAPAPSGGGDHSQRRPPSPTARYFSPGDVSVHSSSKPYGHRRNSSIAELPGSEASYTPVAQAQGSVGTLSGQPREQFPGGQSDSARSGTTTRADIDHRPTAFPPVTLKDRFASNTPKGQDIKWAGSRRQPTRKALPKKSDFVTTFAESKML
ncbi:hypothetical protein LTR85_007848 [Meristemomyces frigidus]|nr:hypothetical protein LTR85_007848 [Meristemomyces frigidus]